MTTGKTKTGGGDETGFGFEAVTAGAKAAGEAAKAGAEAAAKGYEGVLAMGKENVDAALKAGAVAWRKGDDVADFGRRNAEVVFQASTAVAKGWEALGNQWADLARASLEDGLAASRALMRSKSLDDVVAVQTDFVKTAFDSYVTGTTALTATTAHVASQVVAPIDVRISEILEGFTRPAQA